MLFPCFRSLQNLASLLMLTTVLTVAAQPLSGTKTIPGNYATLTAALTDVASKGVSGPLVLELQPAYTSASETYPLTLGNVTGASATNTLTIRPAAGVGSTITFSASNTTAILDLNGARFWIVDGRPGGTGTSGLLTFSNTSTASTSCTVRHINDARENTLRYCTFTGVTTGASCGVVLFSSGSTSGNDNNTLSACKIRDGATSPANGIYSGGTVGKENSGNTVSDCEIFNFYLNGGNSCGIYLNANNDAWTVQNTHFYQTATRAPTTANTYQYGIRILDGSGHLLSGNFIGGGAVNCGGTAWTLTNPANQRSNRFYGIYLDHGAGSTVSVQGNTIANITFGSTSGSPVLIWTGISVASGDVSIGTVTGNTIGSGSATGSILSTASSSGPYTVGVYIGTSGGTAVIQNNTIGGIRVTNVSTAQTHAVFGIWLDDALSATVENNLIGSSSVSGSLDASNASTTTGVQDVTGIVCDLTGGTAKIQNNTIANLTNASATTTADRGRTIGIEVLNGATIINGNTIRNLSSSSRQTSAGGYATVVGIAINTASDIHTVTQNVIHTLSNTATGSVNVEVTGLAFAGAVSASSAISRNFIHSLTLAASGSSATVCGLYATDGRATYHNNMIRLGVDASGSGISGNQIWVGIDEADGRNQVYHNTVYLGGSSTGTSSTFAFRSAATDSVRDYRNNIFANERTRASSTGKHYALSVGGTGVKPLGLTCNNNVFKLSGTGGVMGLYDGTDRASVLDWYLATGQDSLSCIGTFNFVNATGSSSTLDLHLTGNTPAEGAGAALAGITEDFDGDLRSSLGPVDIGADAGNFTFVDHYLPMPVYSPFGALCGSTANRTLLNVKVLEAGAGIALSGGTVPRIWFRNQTTGSAWASAAGTLVSGNAFSSVWTFPLTYSLIGGTPAVGNVIQYYVVAQDLASPLNVWGNPWTGASHSGVSAQTTPPTTPNSYTIVAGLPTTINVGSGQTYTSLTGASGLFNAVNTLGLSGNTTVNVTSDLSEDATNALTNAGMGGFSLTIQPSAATLRTINRSANLSTSMIRLDGAQGVAFDGRSGGSGQYLLIKNTHSTSGSCRAALELLNGVADFTLRNCLLETNITNSARGTVQISSGVTTGISLLYNDLRNDASLTRYPYQAVYVTSTQAVCTVKDNNIYNFFSYGINLAAAADGCEISGNHFYNTLAAATGDQASIRIGGGGGHLISGNYIGGSAPSCGGTAWTNSDNDIVFAGIIVNTISSRTVSIQGNTIQNMVLTGNNSSAYVDFYGIYVLEGSTVIGTVTGNVIGHASTAGSITHAGRTSSYVLGITQEGTGSIEVRNNVIANITSSNTGTGITMIGIDVEGDGAATIEDNAVYSLSTASTNTNLDGCALMGIYCITPQTGISVTGNLVRDLQLNPGSAAGYAIGIMMKNAGAGGTLSRNRIYGIRNASTSVSAYVVGLLLDDGNWTASHNQVALTNAASTLGMNLRGIWDNSNSTSVQTLVYNSVYLGGNATSGTNKCYAYARSALSSTVLKNNLLYNGRTGTATPVALGELASATAQGLISNYNLFVVPDTSSTVNVLGSSPNIKDFNEWKTSSGLDAQSWCAPTTSVAAASLFTDVANGNLNILTGNAESWYVHGKGVQLPGFSADYGSASAGRSTTVADGGTDIGSDEFMPSVAPPACTVSGSHTSGGTETWTFGGRPVASITWTGASLPAVTVAYYSGTVPPNLPAGNPRTLHSYVQIDATGGSGYSYDITLYYDDALLYTISSEAAMVMTKYNSSWLSYDAASVVNTGANALTCTGLTNFSGFTGTQDPMGTLGGLMFTEMTATRTTGDAAVITWSVTEAASVVVWAIESSRDGNTFFSAGELVGHTEEMQVFETSLDAAIRFVRVVAVQADGSLVYGPVAELSPLPQTVRGLVVWPNPVRDALHLSVPAGSEAVEASLYDLSGSRVRSLLLTEEAVIDTGDLPPGLYLLHLRGRETGTFRVVKE